MTTGDEGRQPPRRLRERLRGRRDRRVPLAGAVAEPTPAWRTPPEIAVSEIEVEPPHPEPSAQQEQAAFAYCRELLRRPTADEAAADALDGFRRLMAADAARDAERAPSQPGDGEEGRDQPGDDELLAITRRMAAVSMPDRGSPSERRQAMIASIDAEPQCSCRETAFLLAARANASIEPREDLSLTHHLETCPECRGLDAHMERAERAFRAELRPPETEDGDSTEPAADTEIGQGPEALAEPAAAPAAADVEPLVAADPEPPAEADPEPPPADSGDSEQTTEEPKASEQTATGAGSERLGAGAVLAMAGIVVLAVAGVVATYLTTYHIALASILPGH